MGRFFIAAIATASALIYCQKALAADMPVKAPAPLAAVASWNGFYVGIHAGPAWSKSSAWTFTDPNG